MAVIARGQITVVIAENGEDGKTQYAHIKYSDDGGITFTLNDGNTSGRYIGIYYDFYEEAILDVRKYTWSKIQGGAYGWLDEWDGNKTEIGGKYLVSPRMFSGTKDANENLTGVAFGRDVIKITDNGVLKQKTGVFGIKDGIITFGLDAETGDIKGRDGEFENMTLSGSIKSPFVDSRDFPSVTTKIKGDNVSLECNTTIDGRVIYSISDTKEDIGRRITLVNYLSPTYSDLGNPTGLFVESIGSLDVYMIKRSQRLFFFENGRKYFTLNIGREAVELLGYGVGGEFKGWIVVSRTGMPSVNRDITIHPTVLDFQQVPYSKYNIVNTNFIRTWSDGVVEQCMVSPNIMPGRAATINLLKPLIDIFVVQITAFDGGGNGDGPFSLIEKTDTYVKVFNNGGNNVSPYIYVVGCVSYKGV